MQSVSYLLLSISLMIMLPPAAYGAGNGAALDSPLRALSSDEPARLREKYAGKVVAGFGSATAPASAGSGRAL